MNFRTLLYLLSAIFLGFLIPYLIARFIFGEVILSAEQQLANAMWRGSIYSLFALGYALIFSILGLLNLAHSSVFMWGGYLGLMSVLKLDFPIWLALPVGMLGGGLISVAVDIVAFRPLRQRNAPRISQLISSIGASVILLSLATLVFSSTPQQFSKASIEALPGEADAPVQSLLDNFNIRVTPIQIAIFIIPIALMFLLEYMVNNTKIGKAMRVVAFNPRIASLLSINVSNIFVFTFFLSGALAGAAGVLQGLAFNLTPFMGANIALKGLTVIVLGGLGNIRGAVVGGFLVANIEIMSIALGYGWLTDAVVFSSLFLILLIRPQGLLGESGKIRA